MKDKEQEKIDKILVLHELGYPPLLDDAEIGHILETQELLCELGKSNKDDGSCSLCRSIKAKLRPQVMGVKGMKCTKCGKEEAEWIFGEDEAYCQLCWEAHCSEEWWRLGVWQGGSYKENTIEENLG